MKQTALIIMALLVIPVGTDATLYQGDTPEHPRDDFAKTIIRAIWMAEKTNVPIRGYGGLWPWVIRISNLEKDMGSPGAAEEIGAPGLFSRYIEKVHQMIADGAIHLVWGEPTRGSERREENASLLYQGSWRVADPSLFVLSGREKKFMKDVLDAAWKMAMWGTYIERQEFEEIAVSHGMPRFYREFILAALKDFGWVTEKQDPLFDQSGIWMTNEGILAWLTSSIGNAATWGSHLTSAEFGGDLWRPAEAHEWIVYQIPLAIQFGHAAHSYTGDWTDSTARQEHFSSMWPNLSLDGDNGVLLMYQYASDWFYKLGLFDSQGLTDRFSDYYDFLQEIAVQIQP